MMRHGHVVLLLWTAAICSGQEPGPWATYRGNNQRSGCTDGKPGPTAPKVLWALKTKEHFIAAPTPSGSRLLASALGAFNVGSLYAFDAGPRARPEAAWTKTTPYLRLPSVSSPALSGGKLVFGDGMHQTDGAILHCLEADSGVSLWQLPVPGKLAHLEGSPTIHDGKVYIGGGAAGVVCVDLEKVIFEGKPADLPAVKKLRDKRWLELLALYEKEKKADPDFAIPPTEDRLPRATPVRHWQQGEGKWHVDAALALSGNSVFVASAYLDKEKVGDRALLCLAADSGEVRWRAELKLNPWGGPSIAGGRVIVTGSSIGYYPGAVKGARAFIAALDLKAGTPLWTKDIPAGVVACAALADGVAIVTATDGKVRAFEIDTGERRWIYESKSPFFAPVAVSAGVAYAGDWKGVVHAVDVKTGALRWTLDLGSDPAVKSPGMVYGGPVVHEGRVYLATCNLEGPYAGQPTALVCIGEK